MSVYNCPWASVSPSKTLRRLSVGALAATMLLFYTSAAAQNVPSPQIPLTGNVGIIGSPILNSGTFQMPADADVTLAVSNVNTSAFSIKITSAVSLTATRNVIYPGGRFTLNVENATTGGQSIQIIGPTGSGVTIPNGITVGVWNDGTNYVQIGAAGSGTGCIPSGSTNVLLKNGGAGTCVPSSVTDNGTTVSSTEPLTAPAVNTVINAGSSLSTAITACGSAQTTIQITQTIAVGTGITVPANCTLLFQSAGNLTGTSITINGPVQSSRHRVFGSGLAVTLGPLTTEVPIEWFGGKADATGSVGVGTDNLAPFNAAHTALVAGCIQFGVGGYRFSGTPSISKVNMCVEGQTVGYPATAASISANSTNLYIDSASADGPTFTSAATWGIIRNLAVLRTQTPTGTAKGISVNAGGVIVLNVSVQDSVYNVYFHGAGADGTGQITNNSVGWGLTGLAGAPSPASCGFFVDSSGAIPSASIKFLYDSVTSNLSGTGGGTTGLCASGTNLSDIYTLRFETAGTNLGIDLENTGTGSFVSQDIQLIDSVLNGCLTACLKINGMGSTTDIAPHVFVIGGDFFATGTSAIGAFIENSTNVSLTNVQMFVGSTGSSAQTDVVLNTVNGFQINDNDFSGQSFINISCISSSNGTMTGNKIKTGNTTTGATGIKNVGCSNVVEQGNTIAGNGGIALVNGITFDATSSNNGPWSLNTIDSATVTTPVTDAGTNNNTLTPSILTLAGGSAMNANQGNGAKVQHSTGTTTTNDCVKFDANGNTVDAGAACGSGGSATIIQVNGTPTTTATPVNLQTSTTNSVGLTITPSNPSAGNVKFEVTGSSYTGNAATATLATSSTNLAGGALGSAPYQSAASTTTFIASPTTTDTYFYGWTPTGSTIAPAAKSMTTYLASPAAIGGATPSTGNYTTLSSTALNAGGLVKSIVSTGLLATAVSSDVIALWTGTCSSSTFLRGDGACAAPSGSGNTTSTSLSMNVVPRANGANSIIDSAFTDNGTVGGFARAGGFNPTHLFSGDINTCPDTSGSGTVQVCNTVGNFTPTGTPASCITYTTTTTNSGAGLTLNVNSLSARSIAIPGASGWTTTLTAGIIPANKPLIACYDGTNWNVQQTGTLASGSGITFPQTVGGTTTSGGIPYFSSTTVLTSSALLPTGDFVLGGGAGGAPTASFSVVPVANGGTGAATFTAHSFFGNPTGSTAAPAQSLIGTNDWSPNAYVAGAGSVNVMTATLAPVATAYTAGLQIDVLPNLANTTTTPTLNVNGLGAKTITKCGTTALVAGDYTTTAVAEFVYDGTQMQLVNPQAVGCGSGGSGSAMGTVYHSFVVNNLGVAASNSYTVGSDGLAASVAGAGRGYGYFVVLKAGTITSIDYQVRSPSTGAISATCSMDLESITGTVLTGTTATTAVTGSVLVDVQVTGLSIAVTAGQKISVAFNVPAGATSGSSVVFAASVEVD